LKLSSALKMEAAHSFETSRSIYQIRRLHIPENRNLKMLVSFQVAVIKSIRSVKVNVTLDNNSIPE
jgi:hypothetical protein